MKIKNRGVYPERRYITRTWDKVVIRSVRDYALELPLAETEGERLVALHRVLRRCTRALSVLADYRATFAKAYLAPITEWHRDNITDSLHELVAHLEIQGVLQESFVYASKPLRMRVETLIDFIREVAKNETATGYEARAKLKEWNL